METNKKTEKNLVLNQNKISKESFDKQTIKNWDYISLILLLFSFILILVGFWETETILWNRIKYTTGAGSQWSSANPIYLNTPSSQLASLLIRNMLYYAIGNLTLLMITGIVIYQYIFRKSWFKTTKIFLGILGIFSALTALMAFWQRYSLIILEALPSFDAGEPSGLEWIRGEIRIQSAIIEVYSVVFLITSIFILGISIFIILRHRYQLRKNKGYLNIVLENDETITVSQNEKISNKKLNTGYKPNLKNFVRKIPLYIILILYLMFTLFPVYLAVMASLSTPFEISSGSMPNDPINSMIMNYSSVMFTVGVDEPAFRNALLNSLFIGFGTSFFGLALSVASAYALARFRFRGKSLMTFIILSTQMFPAIILLIPQYIIMSSLGLLERPVVLFGLLLVMATGSTAYVTWMMKGYFETIPIDIEEAAYIDGYGKFSTFIKIVIPLARSGMVAVMVFTFLSAWQEFVLARTFIGETDPRATLPLLFFNYQNLNAPDNPTFYELLSPYSLLVAAPVVIFYLLMQKQLISGVIAGGVK
ncbi:MAG: carbohydrate ABC transporter permease [Candidatus Thorarchaeota archaeon]